MAKLIVLAAILAALLALAGASRFTITTTVAEEDLDLDIDNQSREFQRCDRQIQRQSQQLRRCHQYLSPRRGSFEDEKDTLIEQYGPQVQQKQQQLRDCCRGLQNLQGNRCECQAIEDVVRRVLQQLGPGQPGQQLQQIKEAARSLPRQCQLGIQECPIV